MHPHNPSSQPAPATLTTATPSNPTLPTPHLQPTQPDSTSDYGSDFNTDDEAEIALAFAAFAAPPKELGHAPVGVLALGGAARIACGTGGVSLARGMVDEEGMHEVELRGESRERGHSEVCEVEVARDGVISPADGQAQEHEVGPKAEKEEDLVEDTRSPLSRFRRSRKPLSVSDIVGPSWCELQYFYSLAKYGRIKQTAAMKAGGEVHRVLELEVHDVVPVEVKTREDGFGLRLWNVVQGLQTLRTTGLTRELDVWAVIGGEVVAGIVDELALECPDPELEMALEASTQEQQGLPNQKSITEFFSSQNGEGKQSEEDRPRVYLTDTKTRTSKRLPNASSLRPIRLQLMLYRKMLALLCSNKVPSEAVFAKYNLDAHIPLSSSFTSAINGLDSSLTSCAATPTCASPSPTYTLMTLWSSMISEYEQIITASTLSPILHASFRSQADGSYMGSRTFVYDEMELQRYVDDELAWWKGERETRGVDIEEAFKCRMCDFAEGCAWRKGKEEEAREKFRERVGRGSF